MHRVLEKEQKVLYPSFRHLLLVGGLCIIVFFMGWVMSKEHYEKKLHAAMKAKDVQAAAEVCYSWYESGSAQSQFMYWFSLAWIHAQNGKTEAVKYNLAKAAALIGE